MLVRDRRITTTHQPATGRFIIAIVVGLAIFAVGARFGWTSSFAWIKAFLIVFSSLVLAALPFVAIGAVAASLVSVFVPFSVIERIGALPRGLQLPVAAIAGVAFPICECGSVPLARRLMLRGVAPSTALTFMLAAPILNPVVIASTFVAYRGRGSLLYMVGGRFVLGFILAILIGWVAGSRSISSVLRDRSDREHAPVTIGKPEARWRQFCSHVAGDFSFMARYLLMGAAVAALVQTFLPQGLVGGLATVPVLDTVAMMGLAVILSLCSESDAFIAASFGQLGFGASAQLAFLVFGPMVDMKLGAMYMGTFRRPVVKTIVVIAALGTLVLTTWLRVVAG